MNQTLLLADAELARAVGRTFRGEVVHFTLNDVLLVVIWLIAVPVVIWLVAGLFKRERSKRAIYSHRKLFKSLCRVHGLDRRARRILRKIAAAERIAQPALVFVSPEALDAQIRLLHRPAQIAAFTRLRTQLFGDPADEGSMRFPQ